MTKIPDIHALLSASSAKRWINCPPSARINYDFPEAKTEASEEGTRAHAEGEKILKGEKDTSEDPNVLFYVDSVRRIVEYYRSKGEDPKLFVEQRVDYSHIARGGFGTSDCIILTANVLHIVDFKNGVEEVIADYNPQLRLYALGAVKHFNFKGHIIRETIIQPKLPRKKNSEELTLKELTDWGNLIKVYAGLAWEGSGEYQAGEHCSYCKFKPYCPAYQKLFKEMYIDSYYEIKKGVSK